MKSFLKSIAFNVKKLITVHLIVMQSVIALLMSRSLYLWEVFKGLKSLNAFLVKHDMSDIMLHKYPFLNLSIDKKVVDGRGVLIETAFAHSDGVSDTIGMLDTGYCKGGYQNGILTGGMFNPRIKIHVHKLALAHEFAHLSTYHIMRKMGMDVFQNMAVNETLSVLFESRIYNSNPSLEFEFRNIPSHFKFSSTSMFDFLLQGLLIALVISPTFALTLSVAALVFMLLAVMMETRVNPLVATVIAFKGLKALSSDPYPAAYEMYIISLICSKLFPNIIKYHVEVEKAFTEYCDYLEKLSVPFEGSRMKGQIIFEKPDSLFITELDPVKKAVKDYSSFLYEMK